MAEVITHTQSLVQWISYRQGQREKLAEVNEEIKEKTETEGAQAKHFRDNIKVADWKIKELMGDLREVASENERVPATITLEDFDTAGNKLDVELAKGEKKEAEKAERGD